MTGKFTEGGWTIFSFLSIHPIRRPHTHQKIPRTFFPQIFFPGDLFSGIRVTNYISVEKEMSSEMSVEKKRNIP